MIIELFDGTNRIFGRTYAVRIVQNNITEGELITTSGDWGISGNMDITLENNISPQLEVSISPTDVAVGDGITTSFLASHDIVGTYTYSWYVDGIEQTETSDTYTTKASEVTDATSEGKYNIDVIACSDSSIFASSSAALFVGIADTRAPAEVTDLYATGDIDSVNLSWTNPVNDDFDHVEIIITPVDLSAPSYSEDTIDKTVKDSTIIGLDSDKEYSFVVKSVDVSDNASAGCEEVLALPRVGANPPSWIHGTWTGNGFDYEEGSEDTPFTVVCEFDQDTCRATKTPDGGDAEVLDLDPTNYSSYDIASVSTTTTEDVFILTINFNDESSQTTIFERTSETTLDSQDFDTFDNVTSSSSLIKN
jgi:hypothetical protein